LVLLDVGPGGTMRTQCPGPGLAPAGPAASDRACACAAAPPRAADDTDAPRAPASTWAKGRLAGDLALSRQLLAKLDAEREVAANPLASAAPPAADGSGAQLLLRCCRGLLPACAPS
jgi:hypothetical protein